MFEVPRACATLTEALALPGVDAVTIATPPHTHAELALEAIAAGRHVLCEKPFARDTAEGRAVLAAAERAGIVHLLGTEFRYDAGQALLAQAVRDGPHRCTPHGHVAHARPDARRPRRGGARLVGRRRRPGGGWLGAHGSQLIDQIRATLGDFAGVSASLVHVIERPMTADDGFVVHFRMTQRVRRACCRARRRTAASSSRPG